MFLILYDGFELEKIFFRRRAKVNEKKKNVYFVPNLKTFEHDNTCHVLNTKTVIQSVYCTPNLNTYYSIDLPWLSKENEYIL